MYERWSASLIPGVIIGALSATDALAGPPAEKPRLTAVSSAETAFFELQHELWNGDPQAWITAWRTWVDGQAPLLTAEELHGLIATKRDAISSYRLSFDSHREPGAKPSTLPALSHVTMWSSWDRLRRDVVFPNDEGHRLRSRVFAYDGSVERSVRTPTIGKPRGAIMQFNGRQQFVEVSDPLPQCMLADAPRDFGSVWEPYDLVDLLGAKGAAVLEETVTINDAECLVVISGRPARFVTYLDLDRDFSVVRFDTYEYIESKSAPPTRRLVYARAVFDLQDAGNGVWLPGRIVTERYASVEDAALDEGTLLWRRIAQLTSFEISEPIDETVFSNVFADGMQIYDVITNVSYRHGDAPSVEEALRMTVEELVNEATDDDAGDAGDAGDATGPMPDVDSDDVSMGRFDFLVAAILLTPLLGLWTFRKLRHVR